MYSDRNRLRIEFPFIIIVILMLWVLMFPLNIAQAATVYTNTTAYSNSFSVNEDFDVKISILEEAFPKNWYWNYHDASELGNKKQRKVTINGYSSYISTLVCVGASDKGKHDGVQSNRSLCQSNHYTGYWGGVQCCGFARMIYYLLWNSDPMKDAKQVSYDKDPDCFDLLLPGDYIYSGSKHHHLVVTSIDHKKGTFEYVDCNWGPGNSCKIQWEHTNEKLRKISYWKSSGSYVLLHDPAASYRLRDGEGTTDHPGNAEMVDALSAHKYIIYSDTRTWSEARSFAMSLGEGYDLATMDGSSSNEQSIIEGLVDNYGYACWLGANNLDGNWKWVNGVSISTSDSRWDSGEPSGTTSSGSAEHYLGIYGNSTQTSYATINKWNDFKVDSDTVKGFVVEYSPPVDENITWTPEYYLQARYNVLSSQGYLKAEPYADADNVLAFNGYNRVVDVTGAYRNKYGNVWLKVNRIHSNDTSFETEGYVYAGNCQYVISLAQASLEGTVLPSTKIKKGTSSTIDAVVTSTDSFQSLKVRIWRNPDSTGDFRLAQEWIYDDTATLGTTTTSINLKTLGVNNTIDFGLLDAGSYEIEVITSMWDQQSGIAVYMSDFEVEETGIQEITFTRPKGSFASKLAVLKETFPEGWYWNNWSETQLGSGVQHNIIIDSHTTYVSTNPSASSTNNDLHYWGAWGGTRMCGFARMLFDLAWNMDTEAACYCYNYTRSGDDGYFVDYIAPGDMIFTNANGVSLYYFVTGVSGDTVTYATCNLDGKCGISWNNQTTKQEILQQMKQSAASGNNSYICSPVPINFKASEFTWKPYAVTASTLEFRGTASTNSRITNRFKLSSGDIFYAGTNHPFTDANGVVWTYCCSENNQYGWLRLGNGGCSPTTVVNPSISDLSWDEGVFVSFNNQVEEYFHVGSSATLVLRDTAISNFTWSSSDPDVLNIEIDPSDDYRCTVTALQSGTATITVAGITSPEFIIPECYSVDYEGAVYVIEQDIRTSDVDDWTLLRFDRSSTRNYIPSTIDGYKVTSISHGLMVDDNLMTNLEIDDGITRIYEDAFSYSLLKIESVSFPASMEYIDSGAFAFDFPVFVDFYFEGMNTYLSESAIMLYKEKVGNFGEDYRITFHCREGSFAETYALNHGWDVVYTDSVTLSFDKSSITLFSGVPFSGPVGWDYKVIPENLQYTINPTFTSSNDCVLVYSSGIWPNAPGSATVTATYGTATASMKVKVLGRKDCLVLPGSTKTVEEQAFYGNRSIKAVVLPDGIERIESKAFANCTGILAVWCPSSLKYIAPDAFNGCSNVCLYMSFDEPGIAEQYAQYHELNYVVSPANSQKHRKINVQRPFCGIISARKINVLSEKPCTCRRAEDVQTAHWTGFDAGITRNVRLIAA